MPVSMLICCDFDDCEACSLLSPLVSDPSIAGKAPPSRLSWRWIFVSFVSRSIVAERIRFSDAMLILMCLLQRQQKVAALM